MGTTRALALSTALIVISTTALNATPQLASYRGFQFGTSVVTVARHAGISAEPRIVHQRPELIQELMWLPPRLGTTAEEGDSAQKVLFTFYNDQLSRVVVSYDRRRTEGLTAEDLVEAISTTYGVATIPVAGIAPIPAGPSADDKVLAHWEDPQNSINQFRSRYLGKVPAAGIAPTTVGPNADDKIVAHWEDPQYAITLFRSRYLSTFGLVLVSKRLDGLTVLANAEATLLDDREAPARETARQQSRTDEDRVKEDTTRRVNKAAFKP
jgi:hypothetical protein